LQALVSLIIHLQLHTPNHQKRELRKTREKAEKTQETEDGKKHEKKGQRLVRERKDGEKENQGKILVHQPAAPRAFTTIVFILNGEDWTKN
jgi:hypothetical protein